jgi:hypothetical protein
MLNVNVGVEPEDATTLLDEMIVDEEFVDAVREAAQVSEARAASICLEAPAPLPTRHGTFAWHFFGDELDCRLGADWDYIPKGCWPRFRSSADRFSRRVLLCYGRGKGVERGIQCHRKGLHTLGAIAALNCEFDPQLTLVDLVSGEEMLPPALPDGDPAADCILVYAATERLEGNMVTLVLGIPYAQEGTLLLCHETRTAFSVGFGPQTSPAPVVEASELPDVWISEATSS